MAIMGYSALHINSYFLSNKIHYNLYKEIRSRRGDQFLIPVYKKFKENDIPSVDIDYVFGKVDKAIFVTKIPKVLRLFFKKKFKSYDYLHGHTIISDGIPTFLLSKLKKKEYVVSVRSTDITLFINRSIIFKTIGFQILKHAKAVFFISPSLREKIIDIYPNLNSSKFFLLPNGLDNFWNERERPCRKLPNSIEVKLLFVGEIIPRKNLDILIDFLRKEHKYNYTLSVVGKNTSKLDFTEISKTIAPSNSINYIGEVKSKEELKVIYDSNDIFVLLSKAETFGVVYTEALSRGLPIIYSEGEGMDGFFEKGEVGMPCAKNSISDLEQAIEFILSDYQRVSLNAFNGAHQFQWGAIVERYIGQINAALSAS